MQIISYWARLGWSHCYGFETFLLEKEDPKKNSFAGSLCRKTAKEKAECFTHQHHVFLDRK